MRFAKQNLALSVASDGAAQVGQHLDAALDCRASAHQIKPGLGIRVIGPVDAVVFPVTQPRENGNVGDAVLVAGDEFAARQLLVYYTVQAFCIIGVVIDGVLYFLRGVLAEVMGLPDHGTNAAHLKHQPPQHLKLEPVSFRQ